MHETVSTKYGLDRENIEKRRLNPQDGKYFQEIDDFVRMRKIQNNQMANVMKNQKEQKKTLTSPLKLTVKNLVLAERLREKDVPGRI